MKDKKGKTNIKTTMENRKENQEIKIKKDKT